MGGRAAGCQDGEGVKFYRTGESWAEGKISLGVRGDS
jgi:hypothetical protein